ncbi:type II secretion system F family protein [Leucobacter weissii]|uniref:Type II secretion system F family protein n=1 Tax=Leucobacter weissii TaxID=1983706 RepID=A0A939MJC6_9MICO|nr:type II secretion system F family protein [Leucobacter weissii]MBO1901621.1 type II secretion system F family protein [Leucobacter weissii]
MTTDAQRSVSGRLTAALRAVRRGGAESAPPFAAAAVAARRAAVLLRAGTPAVGVWRAIASDEPDTPELRRLAADLASGVDEVRAISRAGGPEWRMLAAVWGLARSSGAPFASTLERFDRALGGLVETAERRKVLLAGPRSTIRLVIALPPVALLLGALLGFDPMSALVTPAGSSALALGSALLLIGTRWSRGLARRIEEADWVSGWEYELAAIAVRGGLPVQRALLRSVDSADGAGAEWVSLEAFGRTGAMRRSVERAESLGVPLAPLLLAEAESMRALTRSGLERSAERLGVRVLVPLGLCVLPAFILIGVVPVLLAVVSGGVLAP